MIEDDRRVGTGGEVRQNLGREKTVDGDRTGGRCVLLIADLGKDVGVTEKIDAVLRRRVAPFRLKDDVVVAADGVAVAGLVRLAVDIAGPSLKDRAGKDEVRLRECEGLALFEGERLGKCALGAAVELIEGHRVDHLRVGILFREGDLADVDDVAGVSGRGFGVDAERTDVEVREVVAVKLGVEIILQLFGNDKIRHRPLPLAQRFGAGQVLAAACEDARRSLDVNAHRIRRARLGHELVLDADVAVLCRRRERVRFDDRLERDRVVPGGRVERDRQRGAAVDRRVERQRSGVHFVVVVRLERRKIDRDVVGVRDGGRRGIPLVSHAVILLFWRRRRAARTARTGRGARRRAVRVGVRLVETDVADVEDVALLHRRRLGEREGAQRDVVDRVDGHVGRELAVDVSRHVEIRGLPLARDHRLRRGHAARPRREHLVGVVQRQEERASKGRQGGIVIVLDRNVTVLVVVGGDLAAESEGIERDLAQLRVVAVRFRRDLEDALAPEGRFFHRRGVLFIHRAAVELGVRRADGILRRKRRKDDRQRPADQKKRKDTRKKSCFLHETCLSARVFRRDAQAGAASGARLCPTRFP